MRKSLNRLLLTYSFICLWLTAPILGQQTKNNPPPTLTAAPVSAITPPTSAQSSSTHAVAHIPQTPAEFFARARQLTDLEASGVPFHLKATFVAGGHTEFTGDGTYEIWWRSKDQWQVNATLKDYRLVKIERDGKLKVYSSSPYIPLRLRQVLDAVLVRPAAHYAGSACSRQCAAEWKQGHQKINGLDFTKLTSAYICGNGKPKPTLCTLQYYFTADGIPRIFAQGSIDTLYNDFQPFQNVEVPGSITVASGGKTWLDISIRSVEALQPGQKIPFEDASTKTLQRNCAFGSCNVDIKKANVSASKLLKQPATHYPLAAKRRLIQGIVVIDATIDEHGTVREPYVLASAGPLLDEAALESVRKYRYQPTRVNGRPVPVRTTIAFDFTLRH